MWAKAAVENLLELGAERFEASASPLVFSIGPAAAVRAPSLARPPRDITDPQPAGSVAAITFDFADESAEAEGGPGTPDDRGVLVFDIVRGHAGGMKLPSMAPRLATTDVCVRLLAACPWWLQLPAIEPSVFGNQPSVEWFATFDWKVKP